MAKYVAVGVLAVILLATVTYESPEATQAQTQNEQQVTGSFATGTVEAVPSPAVDLTTTAQPEVVTSEDEAAVDPTPSAEPTTSELTLPVSAPRELTYVVKAGQTLSDVAGELLGSRGRWRDLYEANKDKLPDPDHVVVGMTLTFPSDQATTSTRPTSSSTTTASAPRPSTSGGRSYTVAKGDTLYSIARSQLGSGGRWQEIAKLNGIDGSGLRVGAELRLPK